MWRSLTNSFQARAFRPTQRLLVVAACTAAGLALAACAIRPSLDPYPRISERTVSSAGALEMRFLGTSSVVFSDGRDTILFDGFVSRPRLAAVLFTRLRSDETEVRRHLGRAGVQRLSAVFVAHTHFDHALDAPTAARLFEAPLFGTASLATIAAADGYPAPTQRLVDRKRVSVGRFGVTPFEMPHAPDRIATGTVRSSFSTPAHASAYREGGNHAFLVDHGQCRILIVPSAGEAGALFRDVQADVILLGVGRLGRRPDRMPPYWRDTVGATGARLVIPIHWDDFSRPLEEPLVAMPFLLDRVDVALDALFDWVPADVEVRLPAPYVVMDWADQAGRCGTA